MCGPCVVLVWPLWGFYTHRNTHTHTHAHAHAHPHVASIRDICSAGGCRSRSAFGFVASFVAFVPVAMSDSEAERLVLEQDREDHTAGQQMRPLPRQPPVLVLPLSQAAVPKPAMAGASAPSARPPQVPEAPIHRKPKPTKPSPKHM